MGDYGALAKSKKHDVIIIDDDEDDDDDVVQIDPKTKSPVKKARAKSPTPVKKVLTKISTPVHKARSKSPSPAVEKVRSKSPSPVEKVRSKSPSPVEKTRSKSPSPVKKARSKSPSPLKKARAKSPSPLKKVRSKISSPVHKAPTPVKRLLSKKIVIHLVDYSEKAIAVYGDTFYCKEELKKWNGKFNPNLSIAGKKQPGWIFSKSKRPQVEEIVERINTGSKSPKSPTPVKSKSPTPVKSARSKSPGKRARSKSSTPVKRARSKSPGKRAHSAINLTNCLAWLTNKNVDPVTKRKLVPSEQRYKDYEAMCIDNHLIDDESHKYFNDHKVTYEVYKHYSKKEGYCFFNEIYCKKLKPLYTENDFLVQLKNRWEVLDFPKYRATLTSCMTKGQLMAIPWIFKTLKSTHANMFVIDPRQKTIEHFEPHGAAFNHGRGNKHVWIGKAATFLASRLFPNFKYIPPIHQCPNFSTAKGRGFQSVLSELFPNSQLSGTCAVWSMWYGYMRLSNPAMTQKEVLEKAVQDISGPNNDYSGIYKFIKNITGAIVHLAHPTTVATVRERNKRKHRNKINPLKT
jgi:hypothetical protein